ncbi:unnamed protein product, partial [Prorocentrum cordatum]
TETLPAKTLAGVAPWLASLASPASPHLVSLASRCPPPVAQEGGGGRRAGAAAPPLRASAPAARPRSAAAAEAMSPECESHCVDGQVERQRAGDAQQADDGEEDEDHEGYASEPGSAAGFMESGNETDPIERYNRVMRWQKRLRSIQQRLHQARATAAGFGDGAHDQPQGGMRGPRRRIGSMAMQLREGPKKVVGTVQQNLQQQRLNLQQRQHSLQQQYQRQMQELKGRLDQGLSKARSSRARQQRHMVCFVCSMADLVVTSVWFGASPWTLHWYYSVKLSALIVARAMWYSWHGLHYFMFDLCYFSNLFLLVYIWFLPNLEVLFEAAFGLSGVLLISVVLFRNSFVPHSMDRITSFNVHLGPALQLFVLRWYSSGRPVWWYKDRCPGDGLLPEEARSWLGLAGEPCVFRMPDSYSVVPALCVYAVFIAGYCLNQFCWNRKVIEKKGYATLYHHMARDMGIINRLPARLQGKEWRDGLVV